MGFMDIKKNLSLLQKFQESWKGLSFTVDRVCLISRDGFLDPYNIRYTVGLGKGLSSAVTEVNVPYIATIGPHSPSTDGLVGLYRLQLLRITNVSFCLKFGEAAGMQKMGGTELQESLYRMCIAVCLASAFERAIFPYEH